MSYEITRVQSPYITMIIWTIILQGPIALTVQGSCDLSYHKGPVSSQYKDHVTYITRAQCSHSTCDLSCHKGPVPSHHKDYVTLNHEGPVFTSQWSCDLSNHEGPVSSHHKDHVTYHIIIAWCPHITMIMWPLFFSAVWVVGRYNCLLKVILLLW